MLTLIVFKSHFKFWQLLIFKCWFSGFGWSIQRRYTTFPPSLPPKESYVCACYPHQFPPLMYHLVYGQYVLFFLFWFNWSVQRRPSISKGGNCVNFPLLVPFFCDYFYMYVYGQSVLVIFPDSVVLFTGNAPPPSWRGQICMRFALVLSPSPVIMMIK